MRTESCSLFAGNSLLTLSMVLASPQEQYTRNFEASLAWPDHYFLAKGVIACSIF